MNEKNHLASLTFSPSLRVGILGGGQLGRMLGEAAVALGLSPVIYAADASEPAVRAFPGAYLGALDDTSKLSPFFEAVDIVAFENEWVRCDLIEQAAGARASTLFVPSAATLARLRDKSRQKESFERYGIPTARFRRYPGGADWRAWLAESRAALGGAVVLKWGEFGYDGKGVFVDTGDAEAAASFVETAIQRGVALYAEAKVRFRLECAVVAVRSVTDEFRAYPLVVSEQHQGVCAWVKGPAAALGVSPALSAAAVGYAEKLASAEGLYGCFALEFFVTENGELLVNEMAPRVHNTGHYTQDAAATSQFENHWRALLGLPLGETTTAAGFAMRNLLGSIARGAETLALPIPGPRSHVHWYGKRELRPGRKVGHLNGSVARVEELPSLIDELARSHDEWLERASAKEKK